MAHNEDSILPTRGAPPSQRMEPPTPPRVLQPSAGGAPSTSEYSTVSLSMEVRYKNGIHIKSPAHAHTFVNNIAHTPDRRFRRRNNLLRTFTELSDVEEPPFLFFSFSCFPSLLLFAVSSTHFPFSLPSRLTSDARYHVRFSRIRVPQSYRCPRTCPAAPPPPPTPPPA